MFYARRDVRALIFGQGHHLATPRDVAGVDDVEPMLGAMVVHLQAQSWHPVRP